MNQNDEIFGVLNHEPGTGVAVLDCDGRLLYMNDESIRMFFKDAVSADDIVGNTLIENGFPVQLAEERVELLRRVERTGEEFMLQIGRAHV